MRTGDRDKLRLRATRTQLVALACVSGAAMIFVARPSLWTGFWLLYMSYVTSRSLQVYMANFRGILLYPIPFPMPPPELITAVRDLDRQWDGPR